MQENNNASRVSGLPERIDTEEDLLRALRYLDRRSDGLKGLLESREVLRGTGGAGAGQSARTARRFEPLGMAGEGMT
jgi:hypothetical protein